MVKCGYAVASFEFEFKVKERVRWCVAGKGRRWPAIIVTSTYKVKT